MGLGRWILTVALAIFTWSSLQCQLSDSLTLFRKIDHIRLQPAQSVQFWTRNETKDSLARIYKAFAQIHLEDKKPALQFLRDTLKELKHQRDTQSLRVVYPLMRKPVLAEAAYLESFQYALEYYELAQAIGDSNALLGALLWKGAALYYLDRRPDSYKVQHQAYKLGERLGNEKVMSVSARNMTAMCAERDMIDSAYFWFRKGLILMEADAFHAKAMAYSLVSVSMKPDTLLLKRKLHLDTAIVYAQKSPGLEDDAFVRIKTGEYFVRVKQLDSARVHAEKAVEIYKSKGIIDGITHALSLVNAINELENNHEKAIEGMRYIQRIRDTIYSLKTAEKMAEFETKFETHQKERENLLLKADNAEKELAIVAEKRTRNNLIFLGITTVVILLTSFLVFYFRNRVKQSQALAKLEQERFAAVIQAEEEERTRVAKELHDGVAQSLASVKMKLEYQQLVKLKTGQEIGEEEAKTAEMVGELQKEVRSISHNMMPVKLYELGFAKAIKELIADAFDDSHIQAELQMPSFQDLRLPVSVETAAFRVLQECIANIIKHSRASKALIQVKVDAEHIQLSIKDNGVGMRHSEHQGIGLMSISSRVKFLNGTLEYKNLTDGGLQIEIVLPIA